jgi:hypothetical protein
MRKTTAFLLVGSVLASLGFAATAIGSHGNWLRILTGTSATTTMTSTNPGEREVEMCDRDFDFVKLHRHHEEFGVRRHFSEMTIFVRQSAVRAHLHEGDEFGECPPPPGQTTTSATTTTTSSTNDGDADDVAMTTTITITTTTTTATAPTTTTTASEDDQGEDDDSRDDDSAGFGHDHGQFPFAGVFPSQNQGSGSFTGTISGQTHHDD